MDAKDSASMSTVNYFVKGQEMFDDIEYYTQTTGIYTACQTDADCVKLCADFKCKTSGANKRCEVNEADTGTQSDPSGRASPGAGIVAAKARCTSNVTVFKDLSQSKFRQLCSVALVACSVRLHSF